MVVSSGGNVGVDLAEDDGSQGPIFFLSYAHAPAADTVIQFFAQVSVHVHELLGLSAGEDAGYMDDSIEDGAYWSDELMTAIGTCPVFVPLISPRYLRSAWCAREFHAFRRRTVHTIPQGRNTSPVLPVRWAETPQDDIPDVIRNLQSFRPTGPERPELRRRYRTEGMYGLSVGGDESYGLLVWRIAQQIARIHQTHRVEPAIVRDPTTLPSSFRGDR